MEGNNTTLDYNSSIYGCEHNEHLTRFQFYVWGIIANVIIACGMVGNILSIIVMRNNRMRSSMSLYLISMAIYDCTVLMAMSMLMALPTWYLETGLLAGYYLYLPYIMPYCYPIALAAQTGTIYTTVALTVERYIAVCHPLKAANTCTLSRTKRIIPLIFLCCIIYNIPRFFEKTYESHNDTDTLSPVLRDTEFGRSSTYKEVYFIYCHLFVMFVIPLSLLFVLNSFLIKTIRRSNRMRQSFGSAREKNLTVMLIAVVFVFLICQLLPTVDNIIGAVTDTNNLQCSIPYIQFYTVSNLMVVINSAVNFILYCLFGKKFRQVLLKMIRCGKNDIRKKSQSTRSSAAQSKYLNGTRLSEMDSAYV